MIYLFENWKLLLAFFRPYFFLSTFLESRVVNFSFFKVVFKFVSNKTNALEIPCIIAPACPERPPPFTEALTS